MMKRKCMFVLCASMLQCACVSMAVNSVGSINGGSATGSERAKAAAVDLVTLPVQVALVPAILVASTVQSSKEKAAREKQRKDSLIINQWVAKIKADPSIKGVRALKLSA